MRGGRRGGQVGRGRGDRGGGQVARGGRVSGIED